MTLKKEPKIILTKNIGEGKNVFIFSPVFPFSSAIMEKFSSNLNGDYKFIFSNLNPSGSIKTSSYNFENFVNFYIEIIDAINEDSKIYLMGFGIFTIIFSKLISLRSNKISMLFFVEPDFSNFLLAKIFDSENKPIFKYKYLFSYYLKENKEKNKNILKKDLKYLKYFYYNIKRYMQENKILRDLIEYKEKVKIFWMVTAKDCWPLPQILIEEYEFQSFLLEKDAQESLLEENGVVIEEVKKSLN